MDPLQDRALDYSTMLACLEGFECSREHPLAGRERVAVERDRRLAIRKLLKARSAAQRIVWYRFLLMQSAALGRRLPALAEFPAPSET